MPSLKKSVMFSESTVNYIEARTKEDDEISWSKALNEGFKALQWLTKEALPDFDAQEWQAILNVYAGSFIEFNPPFRIASDMMDDAGAIALEELSPEYAALVKKVHGMSQLQQFAILDFVQKFWSKSWDGDMSEIIKQIKEQ